jgi:hypothetical protein
VLVISNADVRLRVINLSPFVFDFDVNGVLAWFEGSGDAFFGCLEFPSVAFAGKLSELNFADFVSVR